MDRNYIEFLVKIRDGFAMITDATNTYIESLTPQEIKEHVNESVFSELKFEQQTGAKLGAFELSNKTNPENHADKWNIAFDTLSKAKATIQDRYHGKDYQFSYWLFGEGKIYRQKLKEKA